MIDIENQIFDNISKVVREHYPDIYMTGEYINIPPTFPSVSLVQKSNPTYRQTQTSASNENHVDVMFEVNIYSSHPIKVLSNLTPEMLADSTFRLSENVVLVKPAAQKEK